MTTMEELMQAVLRAPEERKAAALRVLRGEHEPDRSVIRAKLPEPYIGMKEVAEFLGVSVRSVLRWRVPGHKLGSRTRFRLSEVESYVETKEFHQKIEELKGERDARAKKR